MQREQKKLHLRASYQYFVLVKINLKNFLGKGVVPSWTIYLQYICTLHQLKIIVKKKMAHAAQQWPLLGIRNKFIYQKYQIYWVSLILGIINIGYQKYWASEISSIRNIGQLKFWASEISGIRNITVNRSSPERPVVARNRQIDGQIDD